jgi:hypothetical protein
MDGSDFRASPPAFSLLHLFAGARFPRTDARFSLVTTCSLETVTGINRSGPARQPSLLNWSRGTARPSLGGRQDTQKRSFILIGQHL